MEEWLQTFSESVAVFDADATMLFIAVVAIAFFATIGLIILLSCLPVPKNALFVDMSNLRDSDELTVYRCQAPLAVDYVGPILGDLHAYHAGVAFRNERTADFVCLPTVFSSMLPEIGADGEMKWNDQPVTDFRNSLDHDYWEDIRPIYKISGKTFRIFASKKVPEFQRRATHYKMFSVVRKSDNDVLMPSVNCVDYLQWALKELSQMRGVKLIAEVDRFPVDKTTLYVTGDPVPLDPKTPKAEIAGFYQTLSGMMKKAMAAVQPSEEEGGVDLPRIQKVVEGALKDARSLKDGVKYLYRYRGKFYWLDLAMPPLWFEYSDWEIPRPGKDKKA